jgi:hypothetical protein
MVANLAAGVLVNNGVMNSLRPFENTGPTAIRGDGAPGGSTFTVDGAPNRGNRVSGGALAYVPPADAVRKFKVETAAFDAQHGFTPGENVNVSFSSLVILCSGDRGLLETPAASPTGDKFVWSAGDAPGLHSRKTP